MLFKWNKLKLLTAGLVACLLVVIGFKVIQKIDQKGCINLVDDLENSTLDIKTSERVRYIAIGDTGTNDEIQHAIAKSIKKVCDQKGCDFVLLLGDNFYENGVLSVDDPLFNDMFLDPYELVDVPFFAVLGNHDVRGNTAAQAYFTLKATNWNMPNYSYNFTWGPASFFALNTNCFFLQWSDLLQKLEKSNSKWNIVFGHHTLYSSGAHGDPAGIVQTAWNQYVGSFIDFYYSGHDHHLEHLTVKGEKTEYLVSGAGGKNYSYNQDDSFKKASNGESQFVYKHNGFVWTDITQDQIEVSYFDIDGKKIYSFIKTKD